MGLLGRLGSLIIGGGEDMVQTTQELKDADVPVSEADCRNCADPCDEGHDEYPKMFYVDHSSQMLGSVKPYRRQVVISTGQTDWDHDISSTSGSLAYYIDTVHHAAPDAGYTYAAAPHLRKASKSMHGVSDTASAKRITILNGSLHSISDDADSETVLVLPDFIAVTEIPSSPEGAERLWRHALDPSVARGAAADSGDGLMSWMLEYSCVIMLCSHRRRDNRCGIAAPKLENAFINAFAQRGWESHTQLDTECLAPLSSFGSSQDERQTAMAAKFHTLSGEKRALILKNSHMGGHKFSGNVIIYLPGGSGLWYGRATTHEVEAIVDETVIGGKVLPPLLRGGVNLSRPGCKTLHDW